MMIDTVEELKKIANMMNSITNELEKRMADVKLEKIISDVIERECIRRFIIRHLR